MKLLYTALLALLLLPALSRAQQAAPDTTGGRYYRPVFAGVKVTPNITYGVATTYLGLPQVLLLDLYQPVGDTVKRRPLIVFAHGGGFFAGTKDDPYPIAFCTRMAQLGYVVASIEYRLGFIATGVAQPCDTPRIATACVRGGLDMKAAVRFFRKDAARNNSYRLNPGYVFVAGSSAGAFSALEAAYLDKASEVPRYIDLAGLGGVDGNSGNPSYSSAVSGVLCLSGATESPGIIEAGNAPLYVAHGTADIVVPYAKGKIGLGLPPKAVYGGQPLAARAAALGITSRFVPFKGANHIPFEYCPAYADTVFWTVRDFLRPLLRRPGVALTKAGRPVAPTADAPAAPVATMQLYPNPARDNALLLLPDNWTELGTVELLDNAGRVVRRWQPQAQSLAVPRAGLPAGLYAVRVPGQAPLRLVFE